MCFNPDPNKQAQEVIFSRKLKKVCHPPLRFNNNNVSQASSQKHLGLTLDNRLTFDEHLTSVSNKISKTIGLLRKLQNILPRPALLTIYKCFIRPHLDYGDIIYDQAYNLSFHQKLESIRYNAALTLTGEIRGSYFENSYHHAKIVDKKRINFLVSPYCLLFPRKEIIKFAEVTLASAH